jgi:chaperone modulatory protein CbpM
MTDYLLEITLEEICFELQISEVICVELVEYGIVQPLGAQPSEWLFNLTMVSTIKRAVRLHRDLEMDWTEVALIGKLLDDREQLQAENRILKSRLNRFLSD